MYSKSNDTKAQFDDSMANTTEKDHRDSNEKSHRVESKESSDSAEYRCQKCNMPFDNSVHIPLCLPTGNFYCKQCILKMQNCRGNHDSHESLKIPKDISRLPVLSMLINYKQKKYETARSCETTLTFSKPKLTHSQREVKFCSKHKNEKLLYL